MGHERCHEVAAELDEAVEERAVPRADRLVVG
jgi:hypothetical protein